jgi:glutamyl-tRNA(Gln) amidotransferase subunit D
MSSAEWVKISKLAAKELAKDDVRGVIVTHGTDTLAFTAAALSFMLHEFGKPVALVGAQRSPDRGSFDGVMNLLCASAYATSDIAEKAIVMHATSNDDYAFALRGTKVRKMHSSRRDAFRPVNDRPLAKIWPDGRMETTGRAITMRKETPDAKPVAVFEPRVAMLKAYPSSDPAIIDYYVGRKFRGIIIEGTGMGHVPTSPLDAKDSWLPAIKRAVEAGLHVCVTTQCIYGRANAYVYSNLRKLAGAGALCLGDMLTDAAYVKLGWALAQSRSDSEIRSIMAANVAGEYNARHEYADHITT